MVNTKLNLLSKLKGLQTAEETLLKVAVYLETSVRTIPDVLENGHRIRTLEKLASDCRQGAENIGIIL